jgi:hypothetical protein
MSRATVIVAGAPVLVSPDVHFAGPDAHWTIAATRVVDEITGLPPDSVLAARVEEPRLTTRLGEDGRVGVLVQPWALFPLTAGPGFTAHVDLAAPGFLPRRVSLPIVRTLAVAALPGATVLTLDTTAGISATETWTIGDPALASETATIAALGPGPSQVTLTSPLAGGYGLGQPVSPGPLTTLDFGATELHRRGARLHGRVMVFVPATQSWQPPAAATLDVSHVWRRQADVTNELAKEALRMVSIEPGLYLDRRATSDVFQPVAVANVPGDEKTTVGALVPDARKARLSNAKGLAVGTTLQLDVDQPEQSELLSVTSVAPLGTPAEPADVALAFGPALDHRDGVSVHHVGTPNVLVAKALDTDGLSGDPVVFLADLAFGGTPAVARIGAGASAEYQAVSTFRAAADADGYFAFPPIARVAKVRIVATVPPHPPLTIDLEPDLRTVDQWVAVNVA